MQTRPMDLARRTPGIRTVTATGALVLTCVLAAACGAPPSGTPDAGQRPAITPTYAPGSGMLERLEYDSNKNGKPDTWAYMEGPKVTRIEIDKDEDGKIDRWEFYRADRTVEKVGLSRANTGKPDAWAYQAADGTLDRMEVATGTDGRPNRTEYYKNGAKVRVEEDSDRNGKVDRWEVWAGAVLAEVSLDSNGDGTPDRKITYPSGNATAARTESLR